MVDRLGLVGKTIDGRYRIDAMIGEGAMGAVYRAEHSRLGRTVAIKFLHREYAKEPEALQRFFTEARAVASLGHVNIVDSIDMGELPDGEPYLVLEFLDGRQLSEAIQRAGRLSIRRSLRIARQIAAGLEVVHEAGIIHRDLKSENVFLTVKDETTDHVKILDFGVARILSSRTNATKPGHLVGTPEFMPPEQISDPDHIDTRADVYAAGAILYHMLSGQKPYAGTTQIATLLHKILREPPAALPDDVPPEVQQLVRDAMARDRDQRIPTMKELGARIDRMTIHSAATPFPLSTSAPIIADASPAAASTTPPNMVAPSRRSRMPLVLGAAVLVLGGGIGAIVLSSHGTKASATESSAPPVVAAAPVAAAPPVVPAAVTPPPATPPSVAATPPSVADTPPPVADTPPAAATPPPTTTPGRPPRPPVSMTTASHARPEPGDATTTKRDAEKARLAAELDKARADAEKARADAEKARLAADQKAAADKAKAAEQAKADAASKAATTTPTVTPAPPPPKTGVDVAALRAAVKTKLGPIMACYERARMDDPNLAGTVMVRITEAADGAVTGAQIASTTLGSPAAERCIAAEISRWRLPAPLGGAPATFDYPFAFH